MNIFILIIVLITFLVSFFFVRAIKKSVKNMSIEEVNSSLFNQQFEEIKSDLKRGLIEQDEYKFMEKELSRRVLAYASKNNSKTSNLNKNFMGISILFIFIVLFFVSFSSYLLNGNPNLPDLPFKDQISIGVPDIFYKSALVDIDKNIEKDPENIELYILKANTYSLLKNQKESLSLWKYIINNFSEDISADIYLSYGESLLQEKISEEDKINMSTEAYDMFVKATESSQIGSEIWAISSFYVGLYLYQNDNINDANKIWAHVLEESPKHASWRESLEEQISLLIENNNQLFNNEDILQMVKNLENKLYSTNSTNINDWQKLGRSFFVLGNLKKSIDAYRQAYLLDKDNIETLKGLAEAQLLSLEPDTILDEELMALFNKIVVFEPENLLALWVIAEQEINLNNLTNAKILLNKLLIQLSAGSEEYKLVIDKLNEINR